MAKKKAKSTMASNAQTSNEELTTPASPEQADADVAENQDLKDGPEEEAVGDLPPVTDTGDEPVDTGGEAAEEIPASTETAAAAPVAPSIPAPPAPVIPSIASTMVDPKIKIALEMMNVQFDSFVKNMARGRPVAEREGAQHQMALWRLIRSVASHSGETFTVVFAALLARFAKERRDGVLDERYRFRFLGAMPFSANEGDAFRSALSALITLSDPATRGLALKQVDLTRAFKNFPDRNSADRIIDYFHSL